MGFSIIEMWQSTGIVARAVIALLGGLSAASLVVGSVRLRSLRLAAAHSEEFLHLWRASERRARMPLDPGDRVRGADSAAGLLLRDLCAIDVRGATALPVYERTVRRFLLAESRSCRRGLALLATVGSTAPFIGLFGTVAGIVNAFREMAVSGQGGLGTVSSGIAEALVTTALGILVAIPALWLYNAATAKVADLLILLECASTEFIDLCAHA